MTALSRYDKELFVKFSITLSRRERICLKISQLGICHPSSLLNYFSLSLFLKWKLFWMVGSYRGWMSLSISQASKKKKKKKDDDKFLKNFHFSVNKLSNKFVIYASVAMKQEEEEYVVYVLFIPTLSPYFSNNSFFSIKNTSLREKSTWCSAVHSTI